jgi:hypothetical protein
LFSASDATKAGHSSKAKLSGSTRKIAKMAVLRQKAAKQPLKLSRRRMRAEQ